MAGPWGLADNTIQECLDDLQPQDHDTLPASVLALFRVVTVEDGP